MKRVLPGLLAALAAATPALATNAAGECSHRGQVLKVVDGYAYRKPDGYAEGRMTMQVVLASVALDHVKLAGAEDVDDAIREQVWDQDGGQVALTIDGAEVTSLNAFLPPGTSTSRAGTAFGELSLARNDDAGVAGRFRYVPSRDGELGCDVRFDLAYVAANDGKAATARAGRPLLAGGGDVGDRAERDLEGQDQDGSPTSGVAAMVGEGGAWKLGRSSRSPVPEAPGVRRISAVPALPSTSAIRKS